MLAVILSPYLFRSDDFKYKKCLNKALIIIINFTSLGIFPVVASIIFNKAMFLEPKKPSAYEPLFSGRIWKVTAYSVVDLWPLVSKLIRQALIVNWRVSWIIIAKFWLCGSKASYLHELTPAVILSPHLFRSDDYKCMKCLRKEFLIKVHGNELFSVRRAYLESELVC